MVVTLVALMFVGWLGLNALVVFSVSQVRNLAIRENGEDIAKLPSPTSLACCSAFRTVTYGNKLTGWFAAGKKSRPSIVLVHGYASNLVSTTPLAKALHDRGFSVLAINLGFVTEAHYYSGGALEAQDVVQAVRWVRVHHPAPVVVWGFSAGGHASLLAAARGARIQAVIAEGAPVSPGNLAYKGVLGRLHLPGFVMPRGVFNGFFWVFTRRSPVSLAQIAERDERRVPTLIIQGDADDAVSPDNGKLLAKRTDGELWLMPGVGHVDGYERLKDAYVRRALDFIIRSAASGP
jgi:hypothetical protein